MNKTDPKCWRRSGFVWCASTAAALLSAHAASAGLVLEFANVGDIGTPRINFEFQPNGTRSIAVVLNVQETPERIFGYTLDLRIAGGGPELGGEAGPVFTAADLIAGTFMQNPSTPVIIGGPNDVPGFGPAPQFLGLLLNTENAALPPEPLGVVELNPGRYLLGTLTISAQGFSTPPAQPWTLEFFDPGNSSFFNNGFNAVITPGIANSTLTVVPEPAHYAAGIGFALLAFGAWRRFRR